MIDQNNFQMKYMNHQESESSGLSDESGDEDGEKKDKLQIEDIRVEVDEEPF